MAETIIWHNPRCSKSRQTLALLEEHGIDPVIIKYLEVPPDVETLTAVVEQLGVPVRGLMRTKEALYKELNLGAETDDKRLIEIMTQHPQLIERPVVLHEGRAALGRPPESVLALLS